MRMESLSKAKQEILSALKNTPAAYRWQTRKDIALFSQTSRLLINYRLKYLVDMKLVEQRTTPYGQDAYRITHIGCQVINGEHDFDHYKNTTDYTRGVA